MATYLRISIEKEDAIMRQRQACRALCEARGWTVVREYVDNGVSASKGRDTARYAELLADARAGQFDVVVAYAVDRLARRLSDIERLIETGVKAATVQGGLDLTTPEGEAQASILATFARMEVRQKSTRQKDANAQRAEAGLPPIGRRAFGFDRTGMMENPAEAEALRMGVDLLLNGGSIRSIARAWNAAGFMTSHGKAWSPSTTRGVLLNPRIAAIRAHRTGPYTWIEPPGGKAAWPALVPEDVWRATVHLLADPARRRGDGSVRKWLLTGLALCECGAVIRTGGTTARTPTYRCSRVERGHHWSRNQLPVDRYVSGLVVERLSRPDAADLLRSDVQVDVKALRGRAATVRTRLGQLAELLADGTLAVDGVRAQSARLRADLADVEGRLEEAGRRDVLAPLTAGDDAAAVWAGLDVDRRRAVVGVLFERIVLLPPGRGRRTFDPDSVVVTWRSGSVRP